jgi:hypothetical protein
VQIPLAFEGNPNVPPGNYIAEAWLTTAGARRYSATVGFQVQ